jgi:hypothetical protein
MRTRLWPLATLLVAVGCGGSEPAAAPKQTPAPAKTAAATKTPAATGAPGSKEQASATALSYVRALVDEDWTTACASWTTPDQARMARSAGSCEAALESIFAGSGPTAMFKNVEAGDVRIKGHLAGIDLVQPGQTKPALTFGAVLEDGEWRLKEMDDAKVP